VGSQSGGRLRIDLYPGGQLGSDTDMLSQLRAGAIQMQSMSGLVLSILAPISALSGIGFAFTTREQVFGALDGEVGQMIRNGLAAHRLIAIPKVFESGFRVITTRTRPIDTADDLRGLKIRVPLGALWTSMFRAFGSAPTSINFNEVYSALQTHVVDGQENPLAVVDSGKLYEVQRYCALTNHMWDGFWLVQNQQALAQLPAPLADLVQSEFSRAADLQREDLARLAEALPAKMQAAGMALNTPEPASFRDVLRRTGFYAQWRRRLGAPAWRALEDAVGGLG
jgi:tripartite ATP-independent transporter DctP family solute receptor